MAPLGALLPELVAPPPGPTSRRWVERLSRVECPAITARRDRRRQEAGGEDPIVWREARGANVVDVDGNRFVDLTAAFGVASVGHAHPKVVEAIRNQSERLIHGMGDLYPTQEKVLLGEALAAWTPGDLQQSLFGLNGSDAVEAAIKTALIATGRRRVLALDGSYHGMSLGALSVSGYRSAFRAPFSSWTRQELRLPFPHCADCPLGHHPDTCGSACVAYVERVLSDDAGGGEDVAAILVEPLQARGGLRTPPAGWLASMRQLCYRHGVLLIVDEIYTGLGRTGAPFVCAEEGVVPDLLVVGKSLGGGVPISACVGRPEVMEAWGASRGEAIHTSTFLGHPLGAAAALATLAVVEQEGLVERSRTLGAWWARELREAFADLPNVREVRGRGLMLGVALQRPDGALWRGGGVAAMQGLLQRGFLVAPAGIEGEVISLSPPLVVTEAQLRAATDALLQWLSERAAGVGA